MSSFFDSLSKATNDVAKTIDKAARDVSANVEISWYDNEIAGLKSKWGRECFDKILQGETAEVQRQAEHYQLKIAELQVKKANAVVKKGKASSSSGSSSSGGSSQTQTVAVTVPPGVPPGGTFMAQLPSGNQVSVTVPAGAQPGNVIHLNVPSPPPAAAASAVPVAVGRKV
mmetsp:Transcript_2620/g.4496  ORF Transcript_2620/g.4496 Transcript_2620/m.4496 type:complete len:171 (+) Transcript_2620:94-606(+)|eukprot:CAMPEP_0119312076 /NCGR_PEP_ID=MMETSP1333-20130426/24965_1 /TAXON_ID=418940 /ORGANISM="Scyphosphaera apsteinii, Strain RCC1455" /LENGTH=170 /DNA_ID=CAMNT_0007316627 /DNA_START=94 /DNA_END=606 /DNA_ORIENTATION=-